MGSARAGNVWKTVQTNLEAGRIRLVFVADEIAATLRRLIEFLNERLDVEEAVGIKIQHLECDGRGPFVPSVIGRTARAENRKSAEAGNGILQSVEDFFGFEAAVQKRERFSKDGVSKPGSHPIDPCSAPRTVLVHRLLALSLQGTASNTEEVEIGHP